MNQIVSYERMFMSGPIPANGISHGKDVALCMEVLPHTHLTQTIDSKNPDIQGEYRLAILVTGYHRNVAAFGRDRMSFQRPSIRMTDGGNGCWGTSSRILGRWKRRCRASILSFGLIDCSCGLVSPWCIAGIASLFFLFLHLFQLTLSYQGPRMTRSI